MAKNDLVTYGINYPNPLNNIDHFHVVNSQLLQDVMHVLLKGFLPVETKLMLRNFMAQRFLTLDILNNIHMVEQSQETDHQRLQCNSLL